MANVYINFYNRLNNDLSLPGNLLDAACEIECLKGIAPDDGEAIGNAGRYRINCPDNAWKNVVEKLRESGKSLIYSVILDGADGETIVLDAGEMNSDVRHYTTRLSDRKQLFAYWFEDFVSPRSDWLAA